MKQKMFYFLMLAATLFAACSDDDSDKPKAPSTIQFEDYSTFIGASYSEMIRQYPNPSMSFGDFYMYDSLTSNVEGLTVAINPESQTVYLVMEMLKADAYNESDIDAYFKEKFFSYGVVELEDYDDEGNVVGTINQYNYGNAENQDEATLLITLTANQSVTYMNPFNIPEESEGGSLEEMNPIEAVSAFLFIDEEEIEEEYPDGRYVHVLYGRKFISGRYSFHSS